MKENQMKGNKIMKKVFILILAMLILCQATVVAAPNQMKKEVVSVVRPHVTLEPVEPGWIPDPNCYYVPWAEDVKLKLTLEDFDLLCRTTYCEAGNQSLRAQQMVALVILFRILDDRFPNNIHDVIYEGDGWQFNVVWRPDFDYVDYHQGGDITELACYLAIATYPEDPFDMLYFMSGDYHSGSYCNDYDYDGDMYFSVAN